MMTWHGKTSLLDLFLSRIDCYFPIGRTGKFQGKSWSCAIGRHGRWKDIHLIKKIPLWILIEGFSGSQWSWCHFPLLLITWHTIDRCLAFLFLISWTFDSIELVTSSSLLGNPTGTHGSIRAINIFRFPFKESRNKWRIEKDSFTCVFAASYMDRWLGSCNNRNSPESIFSFFNACCCIRGC